MTRKEEVREFINSYIKANYKGDSYESYAEQEDIDAACAIAIEWANNTLIEKAQSFFRTTHHLHKLDGMELKNFIEDFRKIIKE